MEINLTIDSRLIMNSGIGVYLQNILASSLIKKYKLRLLYNQKDKEYFQKRFSGAVLEEYNAELYSIKELLETSGKTKGTDIFWSPHYNVPLLNFAKKLKVTTIHDVFHLAYYNTLSAKQKMYAKLMMSRATSSSDVIFTVSNFSKKEIIKYTNCAADKIHVVYNGIDFNKFNNQTILSIKDVKVNTITNAPYVLYVGNVKPHKNLAKALSGYKLFLEGSAPDFKDIKFVIVGKKDGFITGDANVVEMLSEPFFAERVIFTGWVEDEDLPALYQNALLFIFPSYYEGFGFPPLEAMAAGCPVISSNTACLPEIYGDSALYFNPDDEAAISEAMTQVISDSSLRNELIRKGSLHAKKFTWEAAIERKIKIIEKML